MAHSKVDIAKRAFKSSNSSLNDAQILNKALVVSDIEVFEAESQLSRDKKFLNDKLNDLELVTISFAEIIGIPKEEIKKHAYNNNILGFWEMDLKESINFASLNNNDIERLKFDLKISQNKSDKELGKSKPTLSLVNSLSSSINQGQANIVPPVDFHKTGSEFQNTIGITAKWDIFNGGKNKFIRQFKKNKSKEYKFRIKDQENKINKKVSENFELLKTSLKNIFNISKQVQNNINILKISRLRFNAGVTSQREIINNQRDLTQSEIIYANSIADYNKNLINLKHLTNLKTLKKCNESEKLKSKVKTSFKEIDLSLACNIPAFGRDEFSINKKEFLPNKKNTNNINENKNLNNESNAFRDSTIRKSNKEENLKQQNKNLNEDKLYDSFDSCEEIKNSQSQKNCFDSYL